VAGKTGFAGDEQAIPPPRRPDKAVHHYPGEHYPAWRRELPQLPSTAADRAFGENL